MSLLTGEMSMIMGSDRQDAEHLFVDDGAEVALNCRPRRGGDN